MKSKKTTSVLIESLPDDEELPEGWKSISLEDYVYIAARIGWRGLKREEYTKEGPLFLAVKDIQENGAIDFQNVTDHLSDYRYDESPEIQLKEQDIIITKDGTIGKIGFVENLPGKVTVNSSLLVVRPSPEILPRFLFFYFRSSSFQTIVRDRITGSSIPHLFQKDIKKFQILVPPLAEQRRLVARIEALLAQVNAARDRLSRVPLIMKRFRQAVLAAACEGRLTEGWREENPNVESARDLVQKINSPTRSEKNSKNSKLEPDSLQLVGIEHLIEQEIPKSWELTNLGNLFIIRSGEAFKKSDYSQRGFKLFQIANVGFGRTVWDQQNFLPEQFGTEYENLILNDGDICIALNRPILGNNLKVTKISCLDLPAILYQRVGCLRSKDPAITNYSFMFMISETFRETVRENLQGTSQPYLNFSVLSKLAIPLPPLAEQREIVRRVNALFERADQIEQQVVAATKRTEALTQAVLGKAFRGGL